MIRIAIAEDHQSLIDGLKLLLQYEEDISIVGAVNNGEDLLKLVRLKSPNLVLTDIRMPKADGIVATRLIKKEFPKTRVLAFTMFYQDGAVRKMLDAGASGYILKNSSLSEVLNAIRIVHTGDNYYDSGININEIADSGIIGKKKKLTKRQLEILELISEGKTSREIANDLFIGIHTVDTHRKNMIRILGLKGKGELLRYALDKKYNF